MIYRPVKDMQVTDGTFSDDNPVFSLDGNYIFFASNRDFNLSFSSFDFDYIYDKATTAVCHFTDSEEPEDL